MEFLTKDILFIIFNFLDLKEWFRCRQLNRYFRNLLILDKMSLKWNWKILSRKLPFPNDFMELNQRMKKKNQFLKCNEFWLKKVDYPKIEEISSTSRFYFNLEKLEFSCKRTGRKYLIILPFVNDAQSFSTLIIWKCLKTAVVLSEGNHFYVIYEPDRGLAIETIQKLSDHAFKKQSELFEKDEYYEGARMIISNIISDDDRHDNMAFCFYESDNGKIKYVEYKNINSCGWKESSNIKLHDCELTFNEKLIMKSVDRFKFFPPHHFSIETNDYNCLYYNGDQCIQIHENKKGMIMNFLTKNYYWVLSPFEKRIYGIHYETQKKIIGNIPDELIKNHMSFWKIGKYFYIQNNYYEIDINK